MDGWKNWERVNTVTVVFIENVSTCNGRMLLWVKAVVSLVAQARNRNSLFFLNAVVSNLV